MSSILDALKKLEEDKKHLEEASDIDPDRAADELVGSRSSRGQKDFRVSPQIIVGGLAAFAVIIIGLSVTVSTILMRPQPEVAAADDSARAVAAQPQTPAPEIVPPDPEPALVASKVPVEATPEKQSEPIEVVVEEEAMGETDLETPRASTATIDVPPETAIKPAISIPPPRVSSTVSKTTSAVSKSVPSREEVRRRLASAREAMRVADAPRIGINEPNGSLSPTPRKPVTVAPETLPELSAAVKIRHGLEDLLVNIVSPSSPTKPKASAIISNMKVFVGERIHTTRARLVQVESNGIVIEITGSGERYFVKQ